MPWVLASFIFKASSDKQKVAHTFAWSNTTLSESQVKQLLKHRAISLVPPEIALQSTTFHNTHKLDSFSKVTVAMQP